MKALAAIYEKDGIKYIHPDFYQASEYIIFDPENQSTESLGEDRNAILDFGFLNLLDEKKVGCLLSFNLRMSAMVVLKKKGLRVLKPSSLELEQTLKDYTDGKLSDLALEEVTAFKNSCSSSCSSCTSGTCS